MTIMEDSPVQHIKYVYFKNIHHMFSVNVLVGDVFLLFPPKNEQFCATVTSQGDTATAAVFNRRRERKKKNQWSQILT